jgi:hypothetical protein
MGDCFQHDVHNRIVVINVIVDHVVIITQCTVWYHNGSTKGWIDGNGEFLESETPECYWFQAGIAFPVDGNGRTDRPIVQ